MIESSYVREVARRALQEDIGAGDITSWLTVPQDAQAEGTLTAKADGVIAGLFVAQTVFQTVDPAIAFNTAIRDGGRVAPGTEIAQVSGPARGILAAERVALNFLQHLSGIATLTAAFSERVRGTKTRIADTRKTTPGLRALEKYAVTIGGGANHRFGLYDGILIKDNHIAVAGGVGRAVQLAKAGAPHTLKVEAEVRNLTQLEEAISAGADAVLLDNMTIADLRKAVQMAAGRVVLEASGGVTLQNVRQIAETGVDLISVGALTHSAPALDISLEFKVASR